MASRLKTRKRGMGSDAVLGFFVRFGAVTVLVMMASLVFVLFRGSLDSMKTFGPKFLISSTWRPNELEVTKRTSDGKIVRDADGDPVMETIPAKFGALPAIYGTAVSSIVALTLAVPLSLGAALFRDSASAD